MTEAPQTLCHEDRDLSPPGWRSVLNISCVLAGVISAACIAASCRADFGPLPGRSLRILVGLSAGGGNDLYARVMAPHLSRHLPGQPTVIVENMPGAGGLIAANYLAHQARRDGTTIGMFALQSVLAQLLEDPGAQFDVRTFPVLGSPGQDDAICVVSRASGIDLAAWRDGHAHPRLGIANYGSVTHADAALLTAALHLPWRAVVGHKGTADMRVAIENGELDGACVGESAYLASFQPHANYAVLVQAGESRAPELAGVPSAMRLVSDDRGRALIGLLQTMGGLSRFYVAAPGTPAEATAVLRTAFVETLRDERFVQAAAAARLSVRAVPAATVERQIGTLLNLPADERRELIDLLREARR